MRVTCLERMKFSLMGESKVLGYTRTIRGALQSLCSPSRKCLSVCTDYAEDDGCHCARSSILLQASLIAKHEGRIEFMVGLVTVTLRKLHVKYLSLSSVVITLDH